MATKPFCPYLSTCGGCSDTPLSYPEFAQAKDLALRQLFCNLIPENIWKEFILYPNNEPIFFRNKIRFGFLDQNGRICPSRHARNSSVANIPIEGCYLQSEQCNEIINFVARFAEANKWSVYLDKSGGKGWLKSITIREGKVTNQIMVLITTNTNHFPNQEEFIASITARFPNIRSIYQTITTGKNNEDFSDLLIWGDAQIQEMISGFRYQISPHAFFQTNSQLLPTLYDEIANFVPENTKTLWDLYAGSATIGIFLSKHSERVVGIESNAQNIIDAKQNILINQTENVSIFEGQVEDVCNSQFILNYFPDVVVVDPPRAGLSSKTIQLLLSIKPKRIIYVSCNPQSCLTNLKELTKRTYSIISAQGVDCFPRSEHCEMITCLDRIK